MPRTLTLTRTLTYSRTLLIGTQFLTFARRLGYSPALVDKLPVALEEELVAGLSAYAVAADGKCYGEASLGIDWSRHKTLRSTIAVHVDSTVWIEGVAPELSAMLTMFGRFVDTYGFGLDRRVMLTPETVVDLNRKRRAYQLLDVSDAAPIMWAGEAQRQATTLEELRELTAAVAVVMPRR